jgi:hypothetical protein
MRQHLPYQASKHKALMIKICDVTLETEAGVSRVQEHPGLHNGTLSQNEKKKKKKRKTAVQSTVDKRDSKTRHIFLTSVMIR